MGICSTVGGTMAESQPLFAMVDEIKTEQVSTANAEVKEEAVEEGSTFAATAQVQAGAPLNVEEFALQNVTLRDVLEGTKQKRVRPQKSPTVVESIVAKGGEEAAMLTEAMTCNRCGSAMRSVMRRHRVQGQMVQFPALRCIKKGCQTFKSLRVLSGEVMPRTLAPELKVDPAYEVRSCIVAWRVSGVASDEQIQCALDEIAEKVEESTDDKKEERTRIISEITEWLSALPPARHKPKETAGKEGSKKRPSRFSVQMMGGRTLSEFLSNILGWGDGRPRFNTTMSPGTAMLEVSSCIRSWRSTGAASDVELFEVLSQMREVAEGREGRMEILEELFTYITNLSPPRPPKAHWKRDSEAVQDTVVTATGSKMRRSGPYGLDHMGGRSQAEFLCHLLGWDEEEKEVTREVEEEQPGCSRDNGLAKEEEDSVSITASVTEGAPVVLPPISEQEFSERMLQSACKGPRRSESAGTILKTLMAKKQHELEIARSRNMSEGYLRSAIDMMHTNKVNEILVKSVQSAAGPNGNVLSPRARNYKAIPRLVDDQPRGYNRLSQGLARKRTGEGGVANDAPVVKAWKRVNGEWTPVSMDDPRGRTITQSSRVAKEEPEEDSPEPLEFTSPTTLLERMTHQ